MGESRVRIHFDSLDRFDGEDLDELSGALPGDAAFEATGTSRPVAIAGLAEVISEISSIAADSVAIAQVMLFLRNKLGRAQVARRRGSEIEVKPDRKLSPGHVYVETPEGLKLIARAEDLPAAIEALRSQPDDERRA